MTGTLVSTCFPADPKKKRHWTKTLSNVCSLLGPLVLIFEWPKCTVRNAWLLGSTKYYMYTQKFIWVSWQSFLHKWQPINSVKWAVEPSPVPKVNRLFTYGFCCFLAGFYSQEIADFRSKNLGQSIFRKQKCHLQRKGHMLLKRIYITPNRVQNIACMSYLIIHCY